MTTDTNGTDAMQSRRFKIPGDAVNRATAEMPDEHRSAIRWLHAHATEQNLSLKELAELVRYDESTLSRIFVGKYEGSVANVVESIEAFKRINEQRATIRRLDFIETALSKKIWGLCETALTYQSVVFLYGNSQVGKTTALKQYAKTHNHGSTIYVRMPEGGHVSHFLDRLAIALRISPEQKDKQLRRRILSAFDDRMLLIVDEVHQVFSMRSASAPIRSLEFIRELYDLAKCGVVLCGTNILREELQTGAHRKMLDQLKLRGVTSCQLPNHATRRDLELVARAYGLEAPEGVALSLESDTIREFGLGRWLIFLQAASRIASKAKAMLTWDHVLKAHAAIKHLERGNE